MSVSENSGSAVVANRLKGLHPTIVSNEEADRVLAQQTEQTQLQKMMLASNDPTMKAVAEVLAETNAQPKHYARLYNLLKKNI